LEILNNSSDTIVGDINSNSNIIDDNVNNSSTSDDSGIFTSSNLGTDSGAQTPNTSPHRRPIYAAERKEDNVLGETLMKPQFDEYNRSKSSTLTNSSTREMNAPSSPSSSSSDDSCMLDMISRAAIYDEIYKLDD
jgi:hypothetical protein